VRPLARSLTVCLSVCLTLTKAKQNAVTNRLLAVFTLCTDGRNASDVSNPTRLPSIFSSKTNRASWPNTVRINGGGGVFLVKLTVVHLVHKFHTFCDTQSSVSLSETVRYMSLCSARLIHSMSFYPTSRPILILFFHLDTGLPFCLFPRGFPTKKPVGVCLLLHPFHMPHPSNQ